MTTVMRGLRGRRERGTEWIAGQVGEDRVGTVIVVVGLVLMWAVFGLANPTFLSAENLVNLTLQSVVIGVIALGVALVLLVGQIDLSVGSVSGLAAAIVAVGTVEHGVPLGLTVLAALTAGALVGLVYAVLANRLGLPSFVFTLAGLLVLAGLQLRVLGSRGTVNLPFESWLVRVAQDGFLPTALAWGLVAGVVAIVVGARLAERARRIRAELPCASLTSIAVRGILLAVGLAVVVAYLGTSRGIGYSFALLLVLVVGADLLLRRTRWGRWMRAIGDDRHSARLAGVPVRRVVLSAFVACSVLAALGGVLAAGRLAAANQDMGGADIYLSAIAAAVIGGTSLFGGRGGAWSALIGALVVQSINNGFTLLSLDTSMRYIVTGLVLAVVVSVDTAARRSHDPRGMRLSGLS